MVCKYHIVFIHPSIRGHLGCFHPRVIWTVLLWKWVCRFFIFWSSWFEFFGLAYSEVGLLDHMVGLLNFGGNSILFFIVFTVSGSHQQCSRVTVSPGCSFKEEEAMADCAICRRCSKRNRTHVGCEAPDLQACLLLHWAWNPSSCQLNSKSQLYPQSHADSWEWANN